MKKINFLIIILVFVSNIISQSHKEYQLSNQSIYNEKLHSNNKHLNKYIWESTELIDSVLITGPDHILSDVYKYFYNTNNKIVSILHKRRAIEIGSLEVLNYFRETFEYDSLGNMTNQLLEKWNDDTWENHTLESKKYDESNNIVSILHEEWSGNEWKSLWKKIIAYDIHGRQITSLFEHYFSNSWDTTYRITYDYDLNGNQNFFLWENWSRDTWNNFRKEISIFNLDGNIVSFLQEDWRNNSWVYYTRKSYDYNSQAQVISFLHEYFRDNGWENYIRRTYNYDFLGNNDTQILETWTGNSWITLMEDTYTYAENGNLISTLHEPPSGINSFHLSRKSYTYNQEGNISSYLHEYWNENNWDLYDLETGIEIDLQGRIFNYSGPKVDVYYKTITSIEDKANAIDKYSLFQNYPNPFNPCTTIKFIVPIKSEISIILYDILGREIKILLDENVRSGLHSIEFNASELQSGVYFYKLESNQYSKTKKLIILK